MASQSPEWDFGFRPSPGALWGIEVTAHELLLLDYTLSSYARLIPDWTLDGLMKWERLRGEVWWALDRMPKDSSAGGGPNPEASQTIPIPQDEAALLLALVPTTYRWGTGPDVAVPLKLKLSQCIRGVYKLPEKAKEEAHGSSSPNQD